MMYSQLRSYWSIWLVALWVGVVLGPSPVSAQEADADEEVAPSESESGEGSGDRPGDDAEESEADSQTESGEDSGERQDDDAGAEEGDEAASDTEDDEGDEDESAEADQPEGTKYELEEVVRRARNNSDLLAEFEAKRDEAEWKAYRAKWAPAPKIESLTTLAPVPANADPDRLQANFDEIADLNIGPFVNHSLDLVVPVYTFGRIKKFRELAGVGVDVTELKREEAQLNAIFQSKRAYYSLRLAQTFQPLLEDGDERIEEKLQEMEDARAFGEAEFDTEDFRKLQIFAAEVDSRLVDNQKLADIARSGLKYLAELEADTPVVEPFDDSADPKELATYQTYLRAAREHRPDLQQLNHAIEARELQAGIEKTKLYPEVFFSTGLRLGWSTEETARQPVCERTTDDGPCRSETDRAENLFAEPDIDPLNRFSVRIGVGLRWNVDILGRHGQIQESQAQVDAIRAQKRRAEGAIAIEIREKFRDAADSLEKIHINARRLEAARRWRDQLGLSIEAAGVESDDAIEPLKAYYQAKAQHLEARYNYLVARAGLAQAVGVQWLEQVDPESDSVGFPAHRAPSEEGRRKMD